MSTHAATPQGAFSTRAALLIDRCSPVGLHPHAVPADMAGRRTAPPGVARGKDAGPGRAPSLKANVSASWLHADSVRPTPSEELEKS